MAIGIEEDEERLRKQAAAAPPPPLEEGPRRVPGSTDDDYLDAGDDSAAEDFSPWSGAESAGGYDAAPLSPPPRPEYNESPSSLADLDANLRKAKGFDRAMERFEQARRRHLESERRKQHNAAAREHAAQTGAQYRSDAGGNLQPVIDPDTGERKFSPSTTPVRYEPKTGEPYQIRTDERGQRKVVDPDRDAEIGENPNDPNDRFIYRKNKADAWEPIDPEEGIFSEDRRVAVASTKALYGRELRGIDLRRTEIDLRLKDPERPKALTFEKRVELEAQRQAFAEAAPRPEPVKGIFGLGGVDHEATARKEAEWSEQEQERAARLAEIDAALAADDERVTLEKEGYELLVRKRDLEKGGPAAYLQRRRQDRQNEMAVQPEDRMAETIASAEAEIAGQDAAISSRVSEIQARSQALTEELSQGVTADRAAEIAAEQQALDARIGEVNASVARRNEAVETVQAGLTERERRRQEAVAAEREAMRQDERLAPLAERLDAQDADESRRRQEVEAMPEGPVREAANAALEEDVARNRAALESELAVAQNGGFPKTADPQAWGEADRAAWEGLTQDEKRNFVERSSRAALADEVMAERKAIADDEFVPPDNWQDLSPAEKKAMVEQFTTDKETTLRAFDDTQRRSSPERKAAIDAMGSDPGSRGGFGWQLADQARGRIRTAAGAAGSSLSSVGTGVLDLATAAQAAFGAEPDQTWTRAMSSGIRDFYDRKMDDRFRDAAATKLSSGLASALSFLAPGGILGKAMGGSNRAITAASAITGAVMNGGQAYSEALDMGMSDAEAFQRLAVGFGLGTTEAVGVGGILAKIDKLAKGGIKRFFRNLVVQGAEEGAQEAVQTAGMDIADILILGKDDPRTKTLEKIRDDAIDAGLWGAATGVLFTGLVDGAARRDRRNAGLPEDEVEPGQRMPEQLAAAETEIRAIGALPAIEQIGQRRDTLIQTLWQNPQQAESIRPELARLGRQMQTLQRVEPAKVPPEARSDLARGLLRIAQGEAMGDLPAAERTPVENAKTSGGVAFVEDVQGTPVITDVAREWLREVAPAADRLISMDEREAREFALQRYEQQNPPAGDAPPASQQQGVSPNPQGSDPGASRPDRPAPADPGRAGLTSESRQPTQNEVPRGTTVEQTAVPGAPPVPIGVARPLSRRETRVAKALAGALVRGEGVSAEAATVFARHYLRNSSVRGKVEAREIVRAMRQEFAAAGGRAREADIVRAIQVQEATQGRSNEELLRQATEAMEAAGRPLEAGDRERLGQAIGNLVPALMRWNAGINRVATTAIEYESGGALAEHDGSLLLSVPDLISRGNLDALLRNPDRANKIIEEEAAHIQGIRILAEHGRKRGVAGGSDQQIAKRYAEQIWHALPKGVRESVAQIYANQRNLKRADMGGHEFLRMLAQGELGIDEAGRVTSQGAVLTEETIGEGMIERIRDYVRGLLAFARNLAANLRKAGVDADLAADIEAMRDRLAATLRAIKKSADTRLSEEYGKAYEEQARRSAPARGERSDGVPSEPTGGGGISAQGTAGGTGSPAGRSPRAGALPPGEGTQEGTGPLASAPSPDPAARPDSQRPAAAAELTPDTAVDAAAAATNVAPSAAQKEAGNYRKGHVWISGLDVSIENPAGSVRRGTDAAGKPWAVTLRSHYGYVRGSEGRDGDHLDVIIKPGIPSDWSGTVFVVNQVRTDTRAFDEHKAVLGASSRREAVDLYMANYSPGWQGLGSMAEVPFEDFKLWATESDLSKPARAVDVRRSAALVRRTRGATSQEEIDSAGSEPYVASNASDAATAPTEGALRRLEDRSPEAAAGFTRGRAGEIRRASPGRSKFSAEFEALYDWADQNSRLSEAPIADRPSDSHGQEHEIWYEPEQGRVFKATYPNQFGLAVNAEGTASPLQYLERLGWQNEVFGDDIRIERIAIENGKLRILTSQPYIDAPSATDEEIADFFESNGFETSEHGGRIFFYNPEANLLVYDAHRGNVFNDRGTIIPIDIGIQTLDRNLQQQLNLNVLEQEGSDAESRAPEGGAPLASRPAIGSVAPSEFYSQLERTIEAKMPNAASPAQVLAIIDPARGSGVKEEEIKWTGTREAVERIARENGGRVPKAALLEHLRNEGAVIFEEVESLQRFGYRDTNGEQHWFNSEEEAERSRQEEVEWAKGEGAGFSHLSEVEGGAYHSNFNGDIQARFSYDQDSETWSMDDGYSLSSDETWTTAELEDYLEELKQSDTDYWLGEIGHVEESEDGGARYGQYVLPGGENYREVVLTMPQGNESYTSPHFPGVPNYVAHMRTNERKDAEGRPGLFIEEIQSDRHQQGREKGYRDDYKQESDDPFPGEFDSPSGVPDAPFRKDWPIQMFKRALRDAVAGGKEWIGWTTGETQAERYDLSKQVSGIIVDRQSNGNYSVQIQRKGFKDYEVVERGVSKQKLPEYIGKELSSKLEDKERNQFEGVDLKVGGEGMRGFYDNILPKEIGKYVKKWGAKVEQGSVAQGSIWRVDITPEMRESVETKGQPLFSRRAEIERAREDGEKFPLDRFKSFLSEAMAIAGSYGNIPGATESERQQAARLALADAARAYDAQRGVPFDHLARRVVHNRLKSLYREEVRQNTRFQTTLDEPLSDGDGATRGDLLSDDRVSPPATSAAVNDTRRILEEVLGELPERMQRVLRAYMAGETGEAIAAQEGISRQAVHQMQKVGFQRLRGKLGERGIRNAEELLSRAAEAEDGDPLEDLLKQLEAEGYLDYGAIEGLQDRAASERPGQRVTGRPDLAFGARDPERMGADAYYTEKFVPQTHEQWQREADEMVDRDFEGTRRAIELAGLSGRGITEVQTKAAHRIAETLRQRMLQSGSAEDRRAFNIFWLAYRGTGTAAGRELAARQDPLERPAERYRKFLTDLMLKPRPEAQKRIDAATTPEEKARLIDEETAALLEKLRQNGINPDDILKDRVTMRLADRKILEEFSALLSRGAASDKELRQRAFWMILKNRAFTDIAKATGLSEGAIKQLKADFVAKMRQQHFGKFKAGAKADADIRIGGQQVDDASAEREFQKWLGILGIVPDAKQGRPKFSIENPAHVMRMARAIQAATRASLADMAYEWWIMNILSGPQTQAVNIAGNTLNAGIDLTLQRGMESLVNLVVRDSKSAQAGEFKWLLKGLLPGIRAGWAMAARAWSAEHDFFEHTVLGTPLEIDAFDKAGNMRAAIPGPAGRLIRIPGRALLFADSLFKTAIGQMEVGAQAYRLAKAEGLKGRQLADRVALLSKTRGQIIAENLRRANPEQEMVEYFARQLAARDETLDVDALVADRASEAWELAREQTAFDMALAAGWSEAAWQGAVEKARELTFQQDLRRTGDGGNWVEDAAAKLQDARGSNKLVGYFFPFVRTPYNIFRLGIRKSPFGAINLGWQAARGLYGLRNGQPYLATHPELVRDLSEQLISWTAMAVILGAVEGDEDDETKPILITGSMPYNLTKRGERELQQRAYGGSYVLRIGGRNGISIDFGRYEPFATVLGTTVDAIRTIKRKGNPVDNMDALWGYFTAQAQSKTFLQGFSDIAQGLEGSKSVAEGTKRFFLQAIVPNIIRQPLRNLDEYVRDIRHAPDIYQALPAGRLAEPRVDLYGQDIRKTGGPLLRILARTPLATDERLHEIDRLLLNWNRENPSETYAPQSPGDTYKKDGQELKMTGEQYRKYSLLAGRLLAINSRGRFSPRQIDRPTKDDRDAVRKLVDDARRQARERLFF